ncbi:CoA-binding domain protein, partial [Tribonema minus]
SLVRNFLSSSTFFVVGATNRRDKFGNKVLRCYQQHGRAVTPVHPALAAIEGLRAYAALRDVPAALRPPLDCGVSVITSPAVTLGVVQQAHELGLRKLWLQPGAESEEVVALAAALGMELIYGGPCVLVELGY